MLTDRSRFIGLLAGLSCVLYYKHKGCMLCVPYRASTVLERGPEFEILHALGRNFGCFRLDRSAGLFYRGSWDNATLHHHSSGDFNESLQAVPSNAY